ncbi:MAG: Cof-type HAD-IIB family hydrolase [Synergistales bacterium]|nr:Cof-type HAD-IIB family hydrolase [Synergistales bacterium]MDY6402020.1 Cof-type HAD-IIB family hydrolase [Synergistales bacterium]MDY6404205.1 Cof-type HAD-IIB family hydrolase [Synergistales bacterium]MDY6411149.1 Cof-type HAD-IIB family hydrolase [Synergistales bacterium]MDY6413952.1 Cof-type HAD-IIB family hydrolase [Synergistales bacterium]
MADIKLIAFDLDGTLLNSKKELTPNTRETLEKAASMGIEIVPSTGRFWNLIPDCVRELDFINYAITLNGAEVYDVKKSKSLVNFEIPAGRALKMARVFDDIDEIIYDCVIGSKGYMRRELHEKIPAFMVGEWQVKLVADFRKPLESEEFYDLLKNSEGVQKIQIFTLDKNLRSDLLKALPVVFRKNLFTSSISNNIEINDMNAKKGNALKFLAEYLKIPIESTIAFGDGLNDVSMIEAAGIGAAMKNSCKEVLDVADFVTADCDNEGVAEGIKKFCF